MSQSNRTGKQNARERVAAEKLRAQQAARRRKQVVITSVVGVVAAVSVGVGIAVNMKTHDSLTAGAVAPVGAVVDANAKNGGASGVLVGSADAPVKFTVFEDFRCPVCKEAEAAIEPVYKQYITAGKLQVTYHAVRLLDANNTGTGSRNGGNAVACAQDSGQFVAMHDVLYANQPDEKTDGYGGTAGNTLILKLAGANIPALAASTTFNACVTSGTHNAWVQKNADAFTALQTQGTPTFYLQGALYNLPGVTQGMTPDQISTSWSGAITTALDTAFTKAGSKAGTPFAIPSAAAAATPSAGATPTATPSAGATPTATPSAGATPTATPSATSSSTGTPSASATTSKS